MIKTINVNGDIIRIEARQKTYQKNPAGFKVIINNKTYHVNVLREQEAIDYAFSKYIKENR